VFIFTANYVLPRSQV